MTNPEKPSLRYLFFTFLKIGAFSWGGFMALIAVVQKQLVEKDKKIGDEVVLDSVSLASVLPGPLAFNVVAYLGWYFRGLRGALISMIALLLPSFFLILLLTLVYFRFGQLPIFTHFFQGVLPAVAAIIVSVAYTMSRKNIKDYKQLILLLLAGVSLIVVRSFFTTLLIMIVGATMGYLLYRKTSSEPSQEKEKQEFFSLKQTIRAILLIGVGVLLLALLPGWLSGGAADIAAMVRDVSFTFSGMSLTLFGGGYVIIPSMQEVIVDGLHWLNSKEFADAIAMGQITPGPIFISATFIGYKVGGMLGAIVATIAIFFPPGFLMIFCSRFIDQIKHSQIVEAIFKGLRPAVIGMIFSAALIIAKDIEPAWPSLLIFGVVLLAAVRFKMNVVYLIPASGLLGILLFHFF